MKLDCLDDHFRSAFQFYRDTGCRLAEPFVGELKGTVIVIPAKYSKSRNEKEIELDMDQIPILLELQKHAADRYTRSGSALLIQLVFQMCNLPGLV